MSRTPALLLASALAAGVTRGAEPAVTFNKDIAPITLAHCAPCHRPGEIGPFSLLGYSDVRQRATQIASVTARRFMPPWKPEPGLFLDERLLTDGQIRLIQDWIAQGAAEGDPADLAAAPVWNKGWRLGTPDLIVEMAESYALQAGGTDVFRTFVIPIPGEAARYVRALEFKPGNARAVHHASLGIDRTRSSRRLDLLDPEPGYIGGMVPDARHPEGQFLGWTPGQAPRPAPPGTAWRLDSGSDLVVQLHMQPTGKPEAVRVSAGLFFTEEPPARAPVGLRLGSQTIDIPAGEREHVIADSYVLPVDVEVLAVQPHAHYLARQVQAVAALPDATTRPLLSIRDWDFRWQDVYRYARPFLLPKGTKLQMRISYDNSADNVRNPSSPPRRVLWGQNTSDEMGDLWLQVVPRSSGDLALLQDDVRRKGRVEDIAAYTKLLVREPGNPLRHDALAILYMEGRQTDKAIAHLLESLRLNPESAPTHYNLGLALSMESRREEASSEFLEALELDPDHADAHNNLGAMLHALGKLDPADSHYRRAIALRPDNVEAHGNLGRLLSTQGRVAEAASHFQRALELRPDWHPALSGLAWIRATASDAGLRDPDQAVRLAERAAELTRHGDALALDALGAAYAAAGRFDRAIPAARSAIERALAAGASELAVQIRRRRELYEQRRPYRDVP